MLKKLSFIISAIIICPLFMHAQPVKSDSSVYLELQRRLSEAPNAADSFDIAINLFDLNFNDEAPEYGEMAYRLARRLGDLDAATSLIGLLSYSYVNDFDKLTDLERRARHLPKSDDKDELLTYLSLRKSSFIAYDISSENRSRKIKELTKEYRNNKPSPDIFENIHRLFELCIYLNAIFNQSEMLSRYYEELGVMIEKLPQKFTLLRYMYYSMAANSYSKQFMPEKAVELDLRLIDCLTGLRKSYLSQNRGYRTLDGNFYNIYTRILSNHDALTPEEVEKYYNLILGIAARNSRVAAQMRAGERPQIYYYMATGQYSKALPLLKKHINELANINNAIYFNRALMKAADAMGDTEARQNASSMYIALLEEYIRNHTSHNLLELTITYELDEARTQAAELRSRQVEAEARNSRRMLAYSITIAALLLILALIFMIQWRRRKRSALELKKAVDDLKQERDNMQRIQSDLIMARDQAKTADRQKTDFIHMISHQVKTPLQAIAEYTGLITDCMEPDKKKYLGRFAEVVQLNMELINSMINDITEISALEASELEVRMRPARLYDICTLAIDSVKPTLNSEQKIVLETEDNRTVITDRRRVEQIVTNLLENAIKFSEHGTIKVAYSTDPERHRVEISVSDQGPGVPADKQEVIFDRFVKLDNSMPGMGLGLYVTRLLTRLMGGEIHVDRAYKGGARFVVSLRAKSV